MSKIRALPALSLPIVIALAALTLIFAYTLQTIPNGSEHYFMIDVGETQIVLNMWGTLHATGYPLYVMLSSAGVTVLRAFAVSPATAPGVVSLIWGIAALALMGAAALQVRRRPVLIAAMLLLYGLTRTVWIHHVIAEIYTFTLLLLAALLLLALWRGRVPGRVYWLALLGGLALGHHRALIVVVPAIVYAVYPEVLALLRRRPAQVLVLLALGLAGIIPYAYLMARAHSGAVWVYGEPGTLPGLWDQFIGREAERFIGMPDTAEALFANIALVTQTILTDVTVIGLIAGIAGLIIGAIRPSTRRAAITLILSGLAAYLFHCFLYTDILSALILITTFSLAFGWLLLADAVLHDPRHTRAPMQQIARGAATFAGLGVLVAAGVITLVSLNLPFITALTTDRAGIEMIALAQRTPPGSTLMIPWGARHFAVGFAKSVLGVLPGVELVDHKADVRAAAEAGKLVTPDTTFYRQPAAWWEEKLGAPVYLHAAAPHLVAITLQPERAALLENPIAAPDGVSARPPRVTCNRGEIVLEVTWQAHQRPPRDLSVFVHLLDADGALLAQDDHSAPVYGWRPLTSWLPGEIVRDVYLLPRAPGGVNIAYGLYMQRADGSFENALHQQMPNPCPVG
jgi:hypothetical protein